MNKKELLFKLVKTAIMEECGDRGAYIVSKDHYEQLAKDFLKYENSRKHPYFIREEHHIGPITGSIIGISPEDGSSRKIIVFAESGNPWIYSTYDLVVIADDLFRE
jgi:hypothetical protein